MGFGPHDIAPLPTGTIECPLATVDLHECPFLNAGQREEIAVPCRAWQGARTHNAGTLPWDAAQPARRGSKRLYWLEKKASVQETAMPTSKGPRRPDDQKPDDPSSSRPQETERRRALLVLMSGALLPGRALAQGQGEPTGRPLCVATPEQTEGPYFLDARLNRSDIRTDPNGGPPRQGTPLELRLNISSLNAGCTPLAGAVVDIWHCDAAGEYSGVEGADHSRFLRGYQVTDGNGSVRFSTIFPGWYPGRAVHIHFKVRAKAPNGREREFTSQLYFDDAVIERIHGAAPYADRRGKAPRNRMDGLFRDGGERLMVPLRQQAAGAKGYAGEFDIALRMA